MNYIKREKDRNFKSEVNAFKLEMLEEIKKINEKIANLEQQIQGDPE